MPQDPRPFRQGRFADLPETPRVPHGFYETEGIDVDLAASPLGPMRVHVRRHGAGPPLLLVHGLMTSSYSWRYVYAPLGEHFTCYAPDLPGNGRSDRPLEAPYRPDVLADWLRAVIEALGIAGCAAIGNSMGGYLCMHLALQHSGALSRLVNLHSPGVIDLRMRSLRAALAVPGSRALLRWMIQRDPLRWAHKNVHYYDESLKSLEEAREYGALLGEESGAEALIKYLAETMSTEHMAAFHARLRERRRARQPFPVPLLLLYADRDPMVPPRYGAVFARAIPSAKLVHLRQASHFAHVDAVARFLRPTLDFLGVRSR